MPTRKGTYVTINKQWKTATLYQYYFPVRMLFCKILSQKKVCCKILFCSRPFLLSQVNIPLPAVFRKNKPEQDTS